MVGSQLSDRTPVSVTSVSEHRSQNETRCNNAENKQVCVEPRTSALNMTLSAAGDNIDRQQVCSTSSYQSTSATHAQAAANQLHAAATTD